MDYESLIEDRDLVQGDSTPIWFFGLPDGSQLDDGNWNARYIVSDKFGGTQLLNNDLSLNSGTGLGDSYPTGTKFIFQIFPADSAQLTGNVKYDCTVEIWNASINYNGEVARFKLNVLHGS